MPLDFIEQNWELKSMLQQTVRMGALSRPGVAFFYDFVSTKVFYFN